MKKLFFAAAIAIVAVGGALSSNAEIYVKNSSSQLIEIPCDVAPTATCVVSGLAPSTEVFNAAGQKLPGSLQDYNYTGL